MIKYFLLPVLAVLLAACGTTPVAAPKAPASRPGVAVVEIGYLNHPPVRGVLTDVNKLLVSESVSRWGQTSPVNASDSDARVCKTSHFDVSERI